MRTTLIAVSCLVVVAACSGTPAPAPKWIKVSETGPADENFVTYADTVTLTKSGDRVRMSLMIDSAVVDDAATDRRRVSWKDEWEYDCQEMKERPLRFTEYSGRMGTGEKMYRYTVPGFYWWPVNPGSVGGRLWKIACGKE
jgi:hypothetical protein